MKVIISFIFITICFQLKAEPYACSLFEIDSLASQEAVNVLEACPESEKGFRYYLKLGDSYYRNNQYTKAIIAYERARLFDSTQEDVIRNLEAAYNQTQNGAKELMISDVKSFKNNILNPKLRDIWVLSSYIFWVILGILIFIKFVLKKPVFSGYAIFLALAVIFSFFSIISLNNGNYAIVHKNSVPALESTNETSSSISTLNSGYKVKVIEISQDWARIELAYQPILLG